MLTTLEAIKKAKKLRALMEEDSIPVKKFFLYGSAARGNTHRWSDIDVAIVCEPFDEEPFREYCRIASFAYKVDPRISIQYFRPEHFVRTISAIANEVSREGIEIKSVSHS